jgi:hypothetical protein
MRHSRWESLTARSVVRGAMPSVNVSMASRPYDGIMPIVRGEVAIPGVELRVRVDLLAVW